MSTIFMLPLPVHDFGFFRYDPGAIQFLNYEEIPLAAEAAYVGLEIRVVGNDSGEKDAIDELLLNSPIEHFFQKQANIDRGWLKVSKFQAKSGWILSLRLVALFRRTLHCKSLLQKNQQGWWSFCKMLIKFVEKMNYTNWFSGNSSKTSPQFSVNRPSYVEMVKSRSSSIPEARPRKKDPSSFSIKKKSIKFLTILPPRTQAMAN
ncbi:protease Do-like 7 isoform X1 [Cucumis melo var. makuwa]|uniref:Protease Do-like 7 isoform X1 n=1 Tax=Cucumis melo var. makuwa TaxID=1194695 RepID=A0A5D3BP75_CUCMM|nr:protease Do-like 7 isoform X1 [Cucumis melo var. makuwa]